MARSVGDAVAQGLESGFRIGTGIVDRRLARERQAEQDQLAREDRGLAMADREERRTRQQRADSMAAIEAQMRALKDEEPGPDAPEADRVAFSRRYNTLRAAQMRSHTEAGGYDFDAEDREAQADIQLFQTAPDQALALPPARRVRAIVAATGRPIGDFIRNGDQPSKVGGSVQDFMAGLSSGDQMMMLASANTILGPEMQKGVGTPSPHGGTIVGKRIERFDPHPQKPEEFIPTVRVYVRKDDDPAARAAEDWLRRTDPNAPEGATAYYLAPLTERRSTDPDDPVRSVSLGKTRQYLEALMTAEQALNDPTMLADIQRGGGEWDEQRYLRARWSQQSRKLDEQRALQAIKTAGQIQVEAAKESLAEPSRAADRASRERIAAAGNATTVRAASIRADGARTADGVGSRIQSTSTDSDGYMVGVFRDGSTRRLVDANGQPIRSGEWSRRVDVLAAQLGRNGRMRRQYTPEQLRQIAEETLQGDQSDAASPSAAPGQAPQSVDTPAGPVSIQPGTTPGKQPARQRLGAADRQRLIDSTYGAAIRNRSPGIRAQFEIRTLAQGVDAYLKQYPEATEQQAMEAAAARMGLVPTPAGNVGR